MRTLTIGNESFNQTTSFSMSTLPSLEIIEIGNYCFNAIASNVSFSSLPELTSLKIGSYSFYDEASDIMNSNIFQVHNCPQLLSIEIGEYSFAKFGGNFNLISLPALQNLTIGSLENESNNFMNIPNLSIRSNINIVY